MVWAGAVVALVTAGLAGLMVRARIAFPVPPLLVAPSVTFPLQTAVGVPVIAPVDGLTERPAGKPVALKLVGELLAVIW